MAFSVNTNAGALLALQNLNGTTKQLNTVQNRVNTGLKVASAKDNAAVFNIAQGLRGDLGGLNAVKSSIDRAISTLDVAIAAGEAVSDLLIQLKEKAVAAKDQGIDTASRTALNDEYKELRDQITTITDNAEFNGVNAVKSGGNAITAILNADGSSDITIAAQAMHLGSTAVTIGAASSIGVQTAASSQLDLI